MRRLLICILALSLLLACGAGCRKTEPETPAPTVTLSKPMVVETITPEPAVEETPVPAVEANPRSDMINPFTGEAVQESIIGKRPFFVMVNNIILAQPQVGISQADMIWELMEEGGITRMMAFFTDLEHVETVGSIRSARYYNVNITQGYDAIIVHAGGSGEALDYIAWGIDDIDDNGNTASDGASFFRDPSRQSHGWEHSLFAHGAGLVELAREKGYRDTHPDGYDSYYGLQFSDAADNQCSAPANHVLITYAGGKTTSFTYDEASGTYTGMQYGSEYKDNNETTLHFKNVLVLNADTKLQEDGLHLTIDLIGQGTGFFCCGGKYTPIYWQRTSDNEAFHFFNTNWEPLSLGVGKTFVSVQQVGSYAGTTEFTA